MLVADAEAAIPGTRAAGFAPRMRELYAGDRAVRVYERDDLAKLRDVLVTIDAEVERRDAALRDDGRGLGDDETRAADGTASEMHQMPIVREAVDTRIFAHRRDGDAVAERDAAKGVRVEEMCHRPLETEGRSSSFTPAARAGVLLLGWRCLLGCRCVHPGLEFTLLVGRQNAFDLREQ